MSITASQTEPGSDKQSGEARPWMIAASVMLATFMVVLDSSVANVALPHIAGNLSASTDESTWVLTSYLVSNAIMLPATGWITRRIGRKRLLMASIVVFTVASLLCGLAVNMPMLITARILQGVGGGGMLPLSQSILLESFPPQQHGTAMAVYGVGIVVAPVIGPTLGGWITDSFSWRWIFLINLPVGVLAMLMADAFIVDPPYIKKAAGVTDTTGFLLMALWVGSLQLILDKGQEVDWFDEPWVCWMALVAVAALVAFIYRELTHPEPIVHLRILGNRNFAMGTLITGLYGVVLYGFTAMLPLFLQTLLKYPALQSGMAVSPRGIGSMFAMIVVGRLTRVVDNRLLLACGFGVLSLSAFMLSNINLEISMTSVILPNLLNGFATGCIFVPLTTMAMGHLPKEEIGNAAGIYNLMRNLGGSIGIASIMTFLVRGTQTHRNHLAAKVLEGNPTFSLRLHGWESRLVQAGFDGHAAQNKALGLMDGLLQQQSTYSAYVDNFKLLGYLALACIPLIILFRIPKGHAKPGPELISE
jgi:DHA2 family multidrug resistance protein